MFTSLRVANSADVPGVPRHGFYFKLEYMYGDANGHADRIIGPFPAERKDLVLEFANVCQGMLDAYPEGKGGFEGYEDVPKYEAYFNEDFDPDEDDPDQEVRDTVGAETEYVPDGSGCVASLTGFSCYYQDGIRPSPYPVTLS